MNFNPTITISIILAICALFAPSITAIINNKHSYKMRKLELDHDIKRIYSDMIYRNKYAAYSDFLKTASDYAKFNRYSKNYTDILSSLHNVLILCDHETLPLLLEFRLIVKNRDVEQSADYLELLTKISKSFNRELSFLSSEEDNNK